MSATETTTSAKPSVLASLAAKLDVDPAKLYPMLKRTCFAKCRNDDEFMAMCIVANTYGLNPILKEIYAFPNKKTGAVVPVVGLDGWMRIINSHPAIDGIEFEEPEDGSYCTAIVYRKDRSHPVRVSEWLDECQGDTEPWRKWPRRMLRHKALIQAARIAFGFSGIYDADEARRIEEATATQVAVLDTGRRSAAAEIADRPQPALPKPRRTRRASASELLDTTDDPVDKPDSGLLPVMADDASAVETLAEPDEDEFLRAS